MESTLDLFKARHDLDKKTEPSDTKDSSALSRLATDNAPRPGRENDVRLSEDHTPKDYQQPR